MMFVAQVNPSFCRAILEQAGNWISPTKGTIWKEDLVSMDWRRRYQFKGFKEPLLVTKIEREQSCIFPGMEVCDATVGYIRH